MKRDPLRQSDTPITVDLECLECHTRSSAELSTESFNELSARWKLSEECEVCGKVTDWSFAEASVEAEEQMDFWDWLATTGEAFSLPASVPQDERRKELRVDLTVPLRVAGVGGEEEQVASENISKTGLCFASSRTYSPGETIRITLQPSGATPQIKTGTIVRSSVTGEGRTLYGVRLIVQP